MGKTALLALFDQINASHRDCVASLRKWSSDILSMPYEHQMAVLRAVHPLLLDLFLGLAEENNMPEFAALLQEVADEDADPSS